MAAGFALANGDRSEMLTPLVLAAGFGLLALAVTRFELFVATILLLRASLDAAKLSSTSVDATGAISLIFVVASIAWLLAQRSRSAPMERSTAADLIPPLAAFFVAAALSAATSDHPVDSLVEALRIGTLVVIVTILGHIARDMTRIRMLLFAVFASAIGPLALAAWQYRRGGLGLISFGGISRIQGTFTHPNPFGAYLFLIVTLGVAVYPHLERRWRLPVALLMLGSGGALLTTYARGAWAATILALVIVGILQDRRILVVLFGAMVVVALAVPSVGVRLSDLSTEEKASGAAGNSLVWRFQYWRQVLALQDDPLLGIGPKEVELHEEAARAPHNDLIRIYVEIGLVGLAAYGWLLWALGREAIRSYRRARDGLPRGLTVAFIASLSGLVLLSLTANVISQLVIWWYFSAIVVLAISASKTRPERAIVE